jgi:prophage regulatory protein
MTSQFLLPKAEPHSAATKLTAKSAASEVTESPTVDLASQGRREGSKASIASHSSDGPPGTGLAEMRRYLRLKVVRDRTGLATATLYRYEDQGLFPKRYELGPGAVGWLESEVEQWLASRHHR